MVMVTPIEHQGFLIVPADQSSGGALQQLIVSVLNEYGLEPDLAGVDADVLDLDRHYRQPGGDFFAVYRQAELVGTMGFAPISEVACELRKMYLLPAARGHGLGVRLLQLAEAQVSQRGFRILQLETASVLKLAVALYERNGYRSVCGSAHTSRCDRIYRKELAGNA